MEYKYQRNGLVTWARNRETNDVDAESSFAASSSYIVPPRPPNGLKNYWVSKNTFSMDGLPGLVIGPNSTAMFMRPKADWIPDDQRNDQRDVNIKLVSTVTSISSSHVNLLMAALMAAFLSTFYFKFTFKPYIGSLDLTLEALGWALY